MPIQYDARSLVPDFEPAIRQLMGAYQQRQQQQQQDQALGLATEMSGVSGYDALLGKDNAPNFLRLMRANPELGKVVAQVVLSKDQKAHEDALEQTEEAKRAYRAYLSFGDSTERNKFLATKIREIEDKGGDASKFREMIGLSPDQQRLYANARLVDAGDAGINLQASLDDLIKQQDLDNKKLEAEKKRQEMDIAASQEARDAAAANAKELEKQDAAAQKDAQNQSLIAQAQSIGGLVQKALDLNDTASTGWGAKAAANIDPTGATGQLERLLGTIKSNVGLDKLLELKRQGGTLGALSEAELFALQNSIGNLDYTQSAAERADVLRRVLDVYSKASESAGGPALSLDTSRSEAAQRQQELERRLSKYRKGR